MTDGKIEHVIFDRPTLEVIHKEVGENGLNIFKAIEILKDAGCHYKSINRAILLTNEIIEIKDKVEQIASPKLRAERISEQLVKDFALVSECNFSSEDFRIANAISIFCKNKTNSGTLPGYLKTILMKQKGREKLQQTLSKLILPFLDLSQKEFSTLTCKLFKDEMNVREPGREYILSRLPEITDIDENETITLGTFPEKFFTACDIGYANIDSLIRELKNLGVELTTQSIRSFLEKN